MIVAVVRQASRDRHGFSILKHQPLPVLLGKYANHRSNRHNDLVRHTAKTPTASNVLVAQMQIFDRIHPNIQHDPAILDKGRRNLGVIIHLHRQIRGVTGIGAPFMDGTD